MKVWDMHCDTLAELRYAQQAGKPKSFLHNDLMMDLERMKQGDYLLQCMACFVHLEPEREKSPLLACLEEIDIFYRLLEQYPDDLMQVRTAADIQTLLTSGKRGMMLTVEEGGACLDSLGALRDLYRLGVRMMTLTWNFKNGLAEPNIVHVAPPGQHHRRPDRKRLRICGGDAAPAYAGGCFSPIGRRYLGYSAGGKAAFCCQPFQRADQNTPSSISCTSDFPMYPLWH